MTSEFLARENIRIFERMCAKIAVEDDQNVFEVETVRRVFFHLNYLWGDWIESKKLLRGPDGKVVQPFKKERTSQSPAKELVKEPT